MTGLLKTGVSSTAVIFSLFAFVPAVAQGGATQGAAQESARPDPVSLSASSPTAPAPESQTAPGPAAVNPQDQAPTQADGIQDIVVTATRRETSLQRTPQAVSVLSGESQFAKGQTRLEDLRTSVPNVNLSTTNNTTQLYVRGIGNQFLTVGGDPGVALYQDGAYVSDQSTTNSNFFDVQRIEVLRGPQGALYGRNATGGAIQIISARPTSTFAANVSATIGDYGRRESEGFVSAPLGIANTEFRVSYQVKHLKGYTDNLIGGQPGAPNHLDDLDSQAVRVQTLTHLPSDGTFRVIGTYYHENDAGSALSVKPTPGVQYPAELLFGAVPSDDVRKVFANVGYNRVRTYTVNADYEQPIGDVTLSVLGNYRHSRQAFLNDCDGTSVDDCRYGRDNESNDYYGDVHLAGPSDAKLRWLVGGTYLRYKVNSLNDIRFSFPLSYVAPGAPSFIPVSFATLAGGSIDTESYAFYADLRLKLTDIWALQGQVRYSHTSKDALESVILPLFGVNVVNAPNRVRNSFVPFKVGVEGQLSRDILVYGNYATAYKDGAINLAALQTTPVRTEQVQSAELGAKTSFFNRQLQVNVAVFHSIYKDLQLSQLIGTVVALVNAPKAEVNGAEAEIVATPLDGLQLRANIGYLDPKLRRFSNSPTIPGPVSGPLQNLAGNQLPYDAKLSLNLGADYKFEPVSGYTLRLGGEYSYHSRIYFNEFNTRLISQKPVGVFNASASVGPNGDRWKVFGYINNITDKDVQTGVNIFSGLIGAARAVSYAPPRSFGVGASVSF